MNTIEKIARRANRVEFSDNGATATIVVRLDRYADVYEILTSIDVTFDVEKKGNFYHICCPLTHLF